jgi:DNA helicase-2/ATP-dependent DNA helicase PcrA
MRSGTQPRDMAVFYRANDMSRPIEQSLAKRQIPFLVIGSGSYYDRMEVKDVLSMLRFVCNPKDGISFHRIANKPARGMGDALIGKLEAFAEKHGMDLLAVMDEQMLHQVRDDHDRPLGESALRACRAVREIFTLDPHGHSVADIANVLLDRTRYDDWLKDRYEDKAEYEARRQNVNELVNSIAEFGRTNRAAGIADYLQSISLYTDHDGKKEENAVRLMSLHASKGLEFDVVYIVGVEQGVLPHEKAVADRGSKGLEEERRLCYVGFTRAKKMLRVTYCQQRQDVMRRDRTARFRPCIPSRFLVEAGLLTPEAYQAAMKEAAESARTATRKARRVKT